MAFKHSPVPMNPTNIRRHIRQQQDALKREYALVGVEVSKQVVVPFCEKHGMKFYVKGGIWMFINQHGEPVMGSELAGYAGGLEVWQVLASPTLFGEFGLSLLDYPVQ